jgi:hypothetical protein
MKWGAISVSGLKYLYHQITKYDIHINYLKNKKMKRKISFAMMAFLASGVLFSSCDKDDVVEANEEEVITTMRLTLTPVGGGSVLTYQFDDPDGPGGANPTKDDIVLAPSKVYNVSVQLLNKTVTPAEDITEEVDEESEAHRFYYEVAAGSNITVNGLDTDTNGVPLGILSTWTTTTAATGKLKVTLRHYPGNPPNKAIADPVNSTKSSTDIEVEFNTRVQ